MSTVDNEQLFVLACASEVGSLNSNPKELRQIGAGDLSKHVALCETLPFNQPKLLN